MHLTDSYIDLQQAKANAENFFFSFTRTSNGFTITLPGQKALQDNSSNIQCCTLRIHYNNLGNNLAV